MLSSGRCPDVSLMFSIIVKDNILSIASAKSFVTSIPCTRTEPTVKNYILQYIQKLAKMRFRVDGTAHDLDYYIRYRYKPRLQRVLRGKEVSISGRRAVGDIVNGADDKFKVRVHLEMHSGHKAPRWPTLPQFGIQWHNSPVAL